MKRFVHLFVVLPFLYCVQVPSLGSLNHLLQKIQTAPFSSTHYKQKAIIPQDGGYALFFTSDVQMVDINAFLQTFQPDASFCPAS